MEAALSRSYAVSSGVKDTLNAYAKERFNPRIEIVCFVDAFFEMLSCKEKVIYYHLKKKIDFQETALSLGISIEEVYEKYGLI